MTQTDLWARADLSSSTTSLYLKGKRGTVVDWRGAETIERMARLLDEAWEDLGALTRAAWDVLSVEAQRDIMELTVERIVVDAAPNHAPDGLRPERRVRVRWR